MVKANEISEIIQTHDRVYPAVPAIRVGVGTDERSAETEVKMETVDLAVFYGKFQGAGGYQPDHPGQRHHRHYRPVRLWEIHPAALAQPDE